MTRLEQGFNFISQYDTYIYDGIFRSRVKLLRVHDHVFLRRLIFGIRV